VRDDAPITFQRDADHAPLYSAETAPMAIALVGRCSIRVFWPDSGTGTVGPGVVMFLMNASESVFAMVFRPIFPPRFPTRDV